jgi:hypothetical protein
MPFCETEDDHYYHDRLGTNTGKAQQKIPAFSYRLGTAGRMNVCFGGVLMLLMAAVCFPFIYFLFDEAWELHSKVPVTEAQVVAAVIALLLIAILPMWIAFTYVVVYMHTSSSATLHMCTCARAPVLKSEFNF